MYDTGRLTPAGKRLLSATWREWYLDLPPIPVPCGKCSACLERKRSEWIKRLSLESINYPLSSFVTLTYDDAHLPSDGQASKRDVQLFLKRFRNLRRDFGVPLPSFKYFIVSEYGKLHGRPHYHGLMFGVDLLAPIYKPRLIGYDKYPRISSDYLSHCWSRGFCLCDRLTPRNIRYVSKYLTKDKSWALYSQCLGMTSFLTHDRLLNNYGLAVADSGKLAISLDGRIGRPPKCFDRYLERTDPKLYERLKSARRDYLKNLPLADIALCRERINLNSTRENQKRILDNGS